MNVVSRGAAISNGKIHASPRQCPSPLRVFCVTLAASTMRAPALFLSVVLLSAPARAVDFVHDVQPIFEQRCYGCHGPRKQESAFRLDHKPSALKGGDSGVAIVPGKSIDSPLVHAITATDPKKRM